MARAFFHRLAGVFVISVISGGLYWFLGDLALAAATGLTWGTGFLITLRIVRQYPSHTTGDGWKSSRWTGINTGLFTLAALIGVSPTLPISAELRLGLGFLVLGVGIVGYTSGTMAELERKTE